MNKILLLLTLFFFNFVGSFAQKSDLVFFTTQDDAFYVFINGIKENTDACKRIKISNLTPGLYDCKIVFKNKAFGYLNKTLITKQGIEVMYEIKRKYKKKYRINWFSETPLAAVNLHLNTTQTTTTHTTHHKDLPTDVHNNNGTHACLHPLTMKNFEKINSSIAENSFESSRLIIAKQAVTNNCLIVDQIKVLMKLFEFESSRIDFAKFAYDYIYDKGNYYQLNDVFNFESSIDDLNNYIKNKK